MKKIDRRSILRGTKSRFSKFQILFATRLTHTIFSLRRASGIFFREFSPIKDYSGKKFELEFVSFSLGEPKYDEYLAKEREATYEAPLRVIVKLLNKTLGTTKEQEIFMADFPLMTRHGTFVINGVERVVVPQLARSFGVLFTANEIKGKTYFGAKIIPSRGAWIEIETDADGVMYARVDKSANSRSHRFCALSWTMRTRRFSPVLLRMKRLWRRCVLRLKKIPRKRVKNHSLKSINDCAMEKWRRRIMRAIS